MSNDHTTDLARPGDDDAAKALAKRPGSGDLVLSMALLTAFFSLSTASFTAVDPVFRSTIEILAVALFALVLGSLTVRWRDDRRYRRQVEAGNIITVDNHLFETWDELRAECGVALGDEERLERRRDLFDAARDLRRELAERREALGDSELGERRMLAEARIRARLLHEVESLRIVQQTQRDVAALVQEHGPAGVTDSEVSEQLRLLLARSKAENSRPPAVDPGHADDRP